MAKLAGLYAIANVSTSNAHQLPLAVAKAIGGGAQMVQYRDKINSGVNRQQLASAVLAVCRRYKIPMLINDHIVLAQQIAADGVHIGQQDNTLQEARLRLGHKAIVGVTCHDSISLAQAAQAQGADYVAFGRFFPSTTKACAPLASLTLLKKAKAQLSLPVIAIGGINLSNIHQVIEAGADMAAVVQGLFASDDVLASALELSARFA